MATAKKNVKAPKKKVIKNNTKKAVSVSKSKTIKPVSRAVTKPEVNTVNRSGSKNKSIGFIIAIVVVVLIAIFVAFFSTRKNQHNVAEVKTIEEINNSLNVQLKEPKNATDLKYSIVDNNVARIAYTKEVSDGYTMDFVLKSSSATEDLVEYDNDFGSIAILMTVICNDNAEVEVTSFVAADDPNIMKSEWYDNDLYYAMTTENLITREDFLQEVNRVIIDNHVTF